MEYTILSLIICATLMVHGLHAASIKDDAYMHPHPHGIHSASQTKTNKKDDVNWFENGQQHLMASLNVWPKWTSAKNVIMFIGDGMGVSTLTASRFYKSQKMATPVPETTLSWDAFPATGLSKTYNTDQQTADSAGTATAFVAGEKTRAGVIGVNHNVVRSNCSTVAGNEVKSFITYGMEKGKWAGVISTARITHATPSATYAHSADRDWEADSDLPEEAKESCWDIARQMVHNENNKDIRILLGGGRRVFFNDTTPDEEYPEQTGERTDGRNLVQDWLDMKQDQSASYVENKEDFDNIDSSTTDYLLGLFEPSHMKYEADRLEETADDEWREPSLAELVQKSLEILKRGPEGYVMLVEGGRIDHAHHDSNAYRALEDTLALEQAVQMAVDNTDVEDTLIIVTADHSHVFTMGGYAVLENDIFGLNVQQDGVLGLADDGKPYTTLAYANGPGFYNHRSNGGNSSVFGEETFRMNLTGQDTSGKDFLQDSPHPLGSETHGGEDVAVYARGPMSHLFVGQYEQHYIAHAAMYINCIGPNTEMCDNPKQPPCPTGTGSSMNNQHGHVLVIISILWCLLHIAY